MAFLPSLTLDAKYFNDWIDCVYLLAGDYAKLMVNDLVGILGRKIIKTRKLYLTRSMDYASYHFFRGNENRQIHVRSLDQNIEEEFQFNKDNNVWVIPQNNFFEILERSERYQDDSHVPIFNQILDIEAMELHKMSSILENYGKLAYVNTDNAVLNYPHS